MARPKVKSPPVNIPPPTNPPIQAKVELVAAAPDKVEIAVPVPADPKAATRPVKLVAAPAPVSFAVNPLPILSLHFSAAFFVLSRAAPQAAPSRVTCKYVGEQASQ